MSSNVGLSAGYGALSGIAAGVPLLKHAVCPDSFVFALHDCPIPESESISPDPVSLTVESSSESECHSERSESECNEPTESEFDSLNRNDMQEWKDMFKGTFEIVTGLQTRVRDLEAAHLRVSSLESEIVDLRDTVHQLTNEVLSLSCARDPMFRDLPQEMIDQNVDVMLNARTKRVEAYISVQAPTAQS
jgi:hypothetical protein